MAETFGVVAGTLSVAALFNNCVTTFDYIQIGRHIGEDYEDCQLKLDVAAARLGRWGAAVNINNNADFACDAPTNNTVKEARRILEAIGYYFEAAYKKSKRYASEVGEQELAVYNPDTMNAPSRRLHDRFKDIVNQRKRNTGMMQRAAWALYDRNSFRDLVNRISAWVDDLEKLFPVGAARQRLTEIEIEEVDDESSLNILQNATRGIDPVLEDVLERRVSVIKVKNSAKDVNVGEKGRFQVGNVVSEGVARGEMRVNDQTNNSGENFSLSKEGRAQIGNSYGPKGLFDD